TGVMALIHPYSLPLLFAFAIVVTVIRRRANAFGYLCRYFALALPFVTYVTVVSQINPLVARHSALGEMKSPSLVVYLFGFGLPLLVATPIYLFASQAKIARANADGAYYLSNEKMEGLRFLSTHSDPNDVVFATIATSRLIPAFAGNTVVWGHWAMSIDLKER